MALSQESSCVPDSQELERRFRDDALRAKELAQRLTVAHNEQPKDPKRSHEARNPAHGIVIRNIRPRPVSIVVEDIAKVRDHNLFVSSLGTAGTRFGQ